MEILVCISHVLDTTFKVKLKEGNTDIDAEGVNYIINPDDEYGLSKAIQLKEEKACQVTVVCVGDVSCEATLRKALAMGADKAIRVDLSPKNSYQAAAQLSKVVNAGKYDLIITGRESIDYNGGAVPGLLSALIGLPLVESCVGLHLEGPKNMVLLREVDNGVEELSAEAPFVLSAKKGLVEDKDLKIPNIRGIMTARQKTIEILPAEASESGVVYRRYSKVEKTGHVKMIGKDQLDELVQVIRSQMNVN